MPTSNAALATIPHALIGTFLPCWPSRTRRLYSTNHAQGHGVIKPQRTGALSRPLASETSEHISQPLDEERQRPTQNASQSHAGPASDNVLDSFSGTAESHKSTPKPARNPKQQRIGSRHADVHAERAKIPARMDNPLLNYHFEPSPKPINCTTFQSTKTFVTDPSHPLHIKARRNAESFDPSVLRWRVHVLPEISKKAALRDTAKNRIKHAFRLELKRRGLTNEGKMKEAGDTGKQSLRGALLMVLSRDTYRTLNFTREEAEENVRRVLDQVVWKLRRAENRRRGGSTWHKYMLTD